MNIKIKCRPISRVLFSATCGDLIIYLVLKLLTGSINLPILPHKWLSERLFSENRRQNLFGLSTRKVYPAFDVTIKAVGSYPTFSPLSRLGRDGIFSVALSVPAVGGTFLLGSTMLYVARTFLLPPMAGCDKTTCISIKSTKIFELGFRNFRILF